MPYTTDEADPDLELYYKGPEIELKRFDSGATTVTPATTDPAKWIQGRQFIYTGRFGLQTSDTAGENKVLLLCYFRICIGLFYYQPNLNFTFNLCPI